MATLDPGVWVDLDPTRWRLRILEQNPQIYVEFARAPGSSARYDFAVVDGMLGVPAALSAAY
jgi:hypothetical protein